MRIRRWPLVVLFCLLAAWAFARSVINCGPALVSRQHDRYYWQKTGKVVWEVRAAKGFVALTFDDGPDPDYTPALLEVLKAYGARATFFPIGKQVERYPDIVRAAVAGGNEIGNHTYSHRSVYSLSAEAIKAEILDAERCIAKVTGKKPVVFRPPSGCYVDPVVDAAEALANTVVVWTWTQDSHDWGRVSADQIATKVLGAASSGDIILLHDGGGNRKATLAALPLILEGLSRLGLKAITLSELLRFAPRPSPPPVIPK